MEDKRCKNKKVDIIIYVLSNPKKISRGGIRCSCKKCKNKKFIDPDVVMMHASSTKKRFMEKYSCWYAHGEPYVSHDSMI